MHMRNVLFAAAALVLAVAAQAQSGALLLTPRDEVPAERAQLTQMRAQPGAAAVSAITLNRHAMDSNVISATVDGKTYRFAGRKTGPDEHGHEQWIGFDGANSLSLVRNAATVMGSMVVDGKPYAMTERTLTQGGAK
jgi:hypothetical protein